MKQKRFFALSLIVLVSLIGVIGFTISNLRGTVAELAVEMNRGVADAILADAKIGQDSVVSVPVLYYDQFEDDCLNMYEAGFRPSARQFEWTSCGYQNFAIEKGLAASRLGEDYLPVASGAGELVSNRGVDFTRWFSTVEGSSKNYGRMFNLSYDAARASFVYEAEEFYPLDDLAVPEETVNADGRNHLFTMNLGVPILVLLDGREEFTVTADDDTFVYINDELVLDMGGIHEATTGRFRISESGRVLAEVEDEGVINTGVMLREGDGAVVRIFHADRDSSSSVFKVSFSNMLLNIVDSSLAMGKDVQVAYDPENPSYVAPLGESLTVRPDRSRAVLTATIAQVGIVVALTAVLVVVILMIQKQTQRKTEVVAGRNDATKVLADARQENRKQE